MTTVRGLLQELPADEREIEAAGIAALGISLDAHVEDFDAATTARLRGFFLRRRDQLKRQVALLREAQQKRRG